jgi:beta-glucanase (GH16 family)
MLFDNVEYHRWTFSDYDDAVIERYHEPQYILLNLAIGGSGGTPSDDTTSMKMQVDWVRIYEPLA